MTSVGLSDELRERIAGAVTSRVVGPESGGPAMFDQPGDRWFAEDRPIRIVHGDSSMFIGGLRALLFQSLHPLAMAGVARHSNYREDPWGRLQRTAEFLAATTFGTVDQAEQAVAIVRRVHERVVGQASDGRPYAANDPHLLRWVHVAEVSSFLAAQQRFGERPLDQVGRDGYVADTAVVARALGVHAPPESEQALHDQLREFRRELRGTREARDAARYLVLTPPMPLPTRPAYGVLAGAAVSLLPVWARRQLWLPWMPVAERVAVRPAGDALTSVLRWALAPGRPGNVTPVA